MYVTEAIIIFLKNPVLGKVKTRLAQSVGQQEALNIYQYLVNHTCQVAKGLTCDKYLFYSDYIDQEDNWSERLFIKKLQLQSPDLGLRMLHAFKQVMKMGYEKVVITGTDCPGLTEEIVEDALYQLSKNDLVIGPATDGGYYLLGLKRLYPEIFQNMPWSTPNVLEETIIRINGKNLSVRLLPELTDIDEVSDLTALYTKFF